jgi:hypothetical protein
MNEHERVHSALSNEPRGDDGLSKRCSSRQDSGLVPHYGGRCGFLLMPELSLELYLQTIAVVSFVANGHVNSDVAEGLANVIEAAAW